MVPKLCFINLPGNWIKLLIFIGILCTLKIQGTNCHFLLIAQIIRTRTLPFSAWNGIFLWTFSGWWRCVILLRCYQRNITWIFQSIYFSDQYSNQYLRKESRIIYKLKPLSQIKFQSPSTGWTELLVVISSLDQLHLAILRCFFTP